MKQDTRAPFFRALHLARASAYSPGEFVEQESFMTAAEIRALARAAGIAPGVSVLDLCCGIAGPGRFIARELGCTYVGVDLSSSAIEIARGRAGDLPCRFEVSRVPPIPPGPFDVVILFETMLAFPEKGPLLRAIAEALTTGGRFAFTMEEGSPLTPAERERMPDADTVWLTPLHEMLAALEQAGLVVRHQDDRSRSHRAVADSLISAFEADAEHIAAQIGRRALDELLAAHRTWSDWLREARVRKIALVAQKAEAPSAGGATALRRRSGLAQAAIQASPHVSTRPDERRGGAPAGGPAQRDCAGSAARPPARCDRPRRTVWSCGDFEAKSVRPQLARLSPIGRPLTMARSLRARPEGFVRHPDLPIGAPVDA